MNSSASRARCCSSTAPQDLRAHGDVEHRDRLVADQPARARARARRRSPRAGAGRPRAGADSGRGSAPARGRRPRSAPATRARGSALGTPARPAARRRSSRTRMRGFSVWYGSWKIICTRRRSARSARARPPAPRRRARSTPAAGGDQPEQRARQRRLPAARLADDAQDLAAPPLERHAVDAPAPRPSATAQVADLQERALIRAPPPPRRLAASAPTARSGRRPTAPGATSRSAGVLQAALGGVGAARAERAAARRPRPGRAARRGSASASSRAPPITGSESSSRFVYGCCGAREHRVDRPGLDDPPRVHDRDPVARLGQHRRGRG